MIDVERTIISQYANSPTLCGLIEGFNECIDPRANIQAFLDYVWNVDTAQGFGLDIWGRIVNIRRELQIPNAPVYFGFKDALPGSYPFDEAPFYDGTPPATQTYMLADDAYRKLILTKALANIASSNAPSINQLLQNMFADRGRCYVNDLGGMQFRYTFEFDLTSQEYAIVTQSGALPRPAGVNAILFQSALPLFGFSEAGLSAAPFGQGVFIHQGAINEAI